MWRADQAEQRGGAKSLEQSISQVVGKMACINCTLSLQCPFSMSDVRLVY